jgi:hypothetical protein
MIDGRDDPIVWPVPPRDPLERLPNLPREPTTHQHVHDRLSLHAGAEVATAAHEALERARLPPSRSVRKSLLMMGSSCPTERRAVHSLSFRAARSRDPHDVEPRGAT